MSELRVRNGAGHRDPAGRRASWISRNRLAKVLKLSTSEKVHFGRIRALVWIAIGLVSFPLGWSDSVVLVWIASFYANAESGFATAEGADDRDIIAKLEDHKKQLDRIENLLTARTPATSN